MAIEFIASIQRFQALEIDGFPRGAPAGSTLLQLDTGTSYVCDTFGNWIQTTPVFTPIRNDADFEENVLNELKQINQQLRLITGFGG